MHFSKTRQQPHLTSGSSSATASRMPVPAQARPTAMAAPYLQGSVATPCGTVSVLLLGACTCRAGQVSRLTAGALAC